MDTRAAAVAATRERIAAAAEHAFTTQWYDDVTIRGIAAEAGVSQQTVLNHFATKEDLCAAALDRFTAAIDSRRAQVSPGDVAEAVAVLVEDYEATGDATLRMLAVEDRVPTVQPWLAMGRREHERWVATVFAEALEGLSGRARDQRLGELVVATDVYAWKLLRRDRDLSPAEVADSLGRLVRLLHLR